MIFNQFNWNVAVAVVALNTRLGCLSPALSPDSEAQKMISAVDTTFREVTNMELGFPIWRFITTPAMRRLFKAQDFFAEQVIFYDFLIKS